MFICHSGNVTLAECGGTLEAPRGVCVCGAVCTGNVTEHVAVFTPKNNAVFHQVDRIGAG
eukprot:5616986-Prymnesium_polylepis.1